jgi:DNA-binding protein
MDLKMVKNTIYNKKKDNEIYISNKRVQCEKFYYKRAYKLIYESNVREIVIYGLGACISKAVRTALFITDCLPKLIIGSVETDTIKPVDDYHDNCDNVLFF